MPQSKPTRDPWVTKKQACRYLGVSERQIERRMDAGQLRHKRLPRESHQPVALVAVHMDDLKAIKQGRPNHYAALVKGAAIPTGLKQIAAPAAAENAGLNSTAIDKHSGEIDETVNPEGVLPSLLGQFARLVAAAAPRPNPRLWQTVGEASQRSGLPTDVLIRAAIRGEIVATRSRPRAEGKRRVSWMLLWDSVAAWRPARPAAAPQDSPAQPVRPSALVTSSVTTCAACGCINSCACPSESPACVLTAQTTGAGRV